MSSLTDRIAMILDAEAGADVVAGILDDARAEVEAVKETCADAKARMLDPASGSAAVTRARKELDDSTLAATRLEAAIERLANHLEAARARETEAAKIKLYEEARVERDALAEDIRTIYPQAAAMIASLLVRIEAADQKIAAVNSDLPDGVGWLEYPEQVARDRPPHEGSPLYRSVRLPALLHQETYWNSFWPAGRQ